MLDKDLIDIRLVPIKGLELPLTMSNLERLAQDVPQMLENYLPPRRAEGAVIRVFRDEELAITRYALEYCRMGAESLEVLQRYNLRPGPEGFRRLRGRGYTARGP